MNISIEDNVFHLDKENDTRPETMWKEYREIQGHAKDTVAMTVNYVVFKIYSLGGQKFRCRNVPQKG